MSLALATLIYEWRRYLAAVIALAFSGLLILAEVGMFTGIVKGVTANIAFTAKGELTTPAVTLYTFKDGSRVALN